MFILFGSPRSGTTLLKECLNLSPEIYIPGQTGILGPLAHISNVVPDPGKAAELSAEMIASSRSFDETFGLYFDRQEVRQHYLSSSGSAMDRLSALFAELARRAGKRVGGDKSPDDLLAIRTIQEVGFLDCDVKILHIVRDVRGIVASLMNATWSPPHIEEFMPRLWSYTNVHLHHECHSAPNYCIVRYEDLLAQPERHLRRICQFLETEYCEGMLDHQSRGLELRTDVSHRNLGKPFLTERRTAWQQELAQPVIENCNATAAEGLEVFGYDLADQP